MGRIQDNLELQESSTRRSFVFTSISAGRVLSAAQSLPDANDLTSLSIAAVSDLVRKKSISPLDLTRGCLTRIERLNPALNAFITVLGDSPLAQARQLESEVKQGRWRGPLHGIPFAVKDNIDTADVRTTAASAVLVKNIPAHDAESVRRLKQAGAILLGKLNMQEFASGGSSVISHFGAVRNPWNRDYIAGGSSGGSGCAPAARLCYMALGTDSGGSVRQPAAYCGVVGLKPTYGRVSTSGIIAGEWSGDHIGSVTRTVTDCALVLQAIAGFNKDDPYSADQPVPRYSAFSAIRNIRIGVPRSPYFENINPEIAAAVEQALAIIAKLTSSTRDVTLPTVTPLMRAMLDAESYSFHEPHVKAHPDLYHPLTLRRVSAGAKMSSAEYIQAREQLELVRREVKQVFTTCDVLVTPTLREEPRTIAEVDRKPNSDPSTRNTNPFNIYGLPSLSIPCGFTKVGIPIGLQICGPHWGECLVLNVARAYEQATDWHKRTPTV